MTFTYSFTHLINFFDFVYAETSSWTVYRLWYYKFSMMFAKFEKYF